MVSASEVVSTQENQTYTYVRCWYRTSHSKDDAATDWKWAKNQDGSDFTLESVVVMSSSFTALNVGATNRSKRSTISLLMSDYRNCALSRGRSR